MAIKSTTSDRNPQPKDEFPKLMISDAGAIVLMKAPGTGVVVGGSRDIGTYSAVFAMGFFKDYHGTVTLENE